MAVMVLLGAEGCGMNRQSRSGEFGRFATVGIGADRLHSLWCIEAVQDRRCMEGRNEMRFYADWSGSYGGVRSGMVVNGEIRQVCYGAAGNVRVAFGFIR